MSRDRHRWLLPDASTRAAWRAWARGDVDEVERLAAQTTPRQRARLLFLTDYVHGRYEQALAHHDSLRARPLEFRRLDGLVVQALLHLDRPAEAAAYLRRRRPGRRTPPDLQLMVDHRLATSLDHTTALPFTDHALAPYLPAVAATLDGHQVNAVLDTGGPFIVMGTQRADALGIRLVANGRQHHGTTRTDSYTGLARELTLGGATLTNVPVEAMPTLKGGQDVVVVGTNILQRFFATIDYPGERLILSPRRDASEAAKHQALLGGRTEAARIPFYLWSDHYMFARGGFGTRQDLNYFIDSGLAYVVQDDDGSPPRQACLYATARQYRSWGVPPARAAGPHFDANAPVSLGPLRQHRQFVATAPGRRTPWASFGGVRIDGLLSHAFLGRYAWTIDFDQHEYVFRRPLLPT